MNETHSGPDACGRCGCPLAGNESYCSNCGRRIGERRSWPGAIVAVLLLLLFVAAGTCVYRSNHLPPARDGPRTTTQHP